MKNVIEISKDLSRIGLLTRNRTKGPEKRLVDSFKRHIPNCFKMEKGAIAIFQEPGLETGYPDLVIVHYLPEVFKNWSPTRNQLKSADLKIIQYLCYQRLADSDKLRADLGIAAKNLFLSIERLLDAQLITRKHSQWALPRFNSIFGLKSIVAIEAKIKNWNEAFHQAQMNQWFSSHSYVLSPIEKPNDTIAKRSKETGVGIFLLNKNYVRRFRRARRYKIPSSYGSWIINEWIGRYINHKN